MSDRAVVQKAFPEDKLTNLLHTGRYGKPVWSNTNRKVTNRRRVGVDKQEA